ncbi:MAG: trypsin-like peptidase domain-containing protein [Clostridia bacterium]|nr:trypsin-like peptidase domain-containing protein [Clostridia bacterium]
MKKCASCEKYAESSAAFCPYCGTQFPKDESSGNNSIFLKYAEFMDNDALYKVACGMEFGVLHEKTEGELEEILRLLAFRGHLESMFKYAMLCLKRDPEDEENTEIAIRWLKIAADAGHEQSKNYLYTQYGQRVRSMQMSPLIMEGTGSGLEGLVRDSLPAIVSILSSIRVSKRKRKTSAGSGFVVEGGYVITNAHVVGDDPEYVIAKFEPSLDNKSYNLLPLIVDHNLDIAVLKFTGDMARRISSNRQLQLRLNDVAYGEKVYTIGNPLGMGLSVSDGIVSCPDRTTNYPRNAKYVIQTDITVNHGNSGGALLDVNNRVLGVITFFPNGSEGGIGMCVPSEYVVKVLNRLRK